MELPLELKYRPFNISERLSGIDELAGRFADLRDKQKDEVFHATYVKRLRAKHSDTVALEAQKEDSLEGRCETFKDGISGGIPGVIDDHRFYDIGFYIRDPENSDLNLIAKKGNVKKRISGNDEIAQYHDKYTIAVSKNGREIVIPLVSDGEHIGSVFLRSREGPVYIEELSDFFRNYFDKVATNLSNVIQRERLSDAYDELIEAYHKLEVLYNDLEGLSHSIIHELRTPLVSIGGFASRLKRTLDGSCAEKQYKGNKKYLGIIVDETRRMTNLVNELLDFLREESNNELSMAEYDTNSRIKEICGTLGLEAKKAGLEYSLSLDQSLGSALLDKNRMDKILYNLLSNPIKHAQPGKVEVETRLTDDGIYVGVINNGNIPENMIDKVFEPFKTTKEGRGGTGLGLYTAEACVKKLGGKIEASNLGNNRVLFSVYLPYNQPQNLNK